MEKSERLFRVKLTLSNKLPPKILSRLHSLGLTAGTKVKIIKVAPFGGTIQIRYGDCDLVISKNLADIILEQQPD